MADKFQNRYRIESNRLKNWDYSSDGIYFITMITQNRECILGKIKNNKIILSDFGKIVETEWYKSFEIRDELFLDEFVIMPNHLHAIIILKKNDKNEPIEPIVDTNDLQSSNNHQSPNKKLDNDLSTSINQQSPVFKRKPKSISSFIAGFKSGVNSKIDDYIDDNNLDIPKYNRNNHFWQSNYYDHIIRNDESFHRIKQYIINNPAKWGDDKLNNADDDK